MAGKKTQNKPRKYMKPEDSQKSRRDFVKNGGRRDFRFGLN